MTKKKEVKRETDKEKNHNFSKQGKKNRAAGVRFEYKVRADLEEKGWLVDKWMNNIDFEQGKVVIAKRKYNPYLRALSIGNGFPDFICFRKKERSSKNIDKEKNPDFEIIAIEVKKNGYLDKEEKKRCKWYLDEGIFPKIYIAICRRGKKDKRQTFIEYEDFENIYLDKNREIVKKKPRKPKKD
ncbi:MAG TPA: hypothetical protein VJ912_01830 [Candidatus Nanoarchaeia archaeon]|nr:hypothetical protein [Candidatus Nanoarchaeia archaeon]